MKRLIGAALALFMLLALTACGAQEAGTDYLVLVNKENKLPDGYEQSLKTTTIKNSLGDDVEVETQAYDAYLKLKDALDKEDVHIDLDSARRSVKAQQKIWDDFMEKYGEAYTKRTVAVPGFSEHHTGLALDLYLNVDGQDVYENEDMVTYPEVWEKIHAKLADYGFILRYLEGKEAVTGYGYEPWHIRYVGSADIAKEITDKGITLEEYLDKLPKGDVAPPKDEDAAPANSQNDNNETNSADRPADVIVTIGDETFKLHNEAELVDLRYPENYVDFNTDQIANTKMMSYNYDGEFSFEVRINCEEEHSIEEIKELMTEYEEQSKEVNGVTYAYYEYKSDLGDDAHYYLCEYKDKVYSIIFFLGHNPGDLEDVFMNNVRFV